MSKSTNRSYNLPTCTLKIGAKKTAIFPSIKRSGQEENYFELDFNDSVQTNSAKQITICGDRTQLQRLSVAVNDYVRKFLALTPASLSLEANKSLQSRENNNYSPSLQPKSSVAHQLYLGSLATEKSGKAIELSALQLFDLATALEKYATDVAVIENRATKKIFPSKILTASAIAILGTLALAIKLLNSPTPQTQTISSSPETETQTEKQLKETAENKPFQVLPPPTPEEDIARSQPALPAPEPRSKTEQLPPPPPVNPPQPTIQQPRNITKIPPPPFQATQPENTQQRSRQNSDRNPSQPYILESNPDNSESKPTEKYSFRDPLAIRNANQERNNPEKTAILAQANQYLKQQWQPPKDLKRILEYRLIINKDGSIASVIPLGYPSQIYRDRSGIPLPGEAFVSQFSEQETLKIRVFLIPDGKVNTFLE